MPSAWQALWDRFSGLVRCLADRAALRAHSRRILDELVELGLHALNLFARRLVERRVVGGVAHVLGVRDELPAEIEVVDGAAVVSGVDDRHGGARQ